MNPLNHPKQLLAFAHRGEAKSFLKHIRWTPVNDMDNLYESSSNYLLITGEGRFETLMTLTTACTLLKPDLIVNYGTSGALRENVQVGSIYPVRTAYASEGINPQFKSYTTNIDDAVVDCISAGERVQDKKIASQLGNFAHLVDREVWSIGAVAHRFKTPFCSYKLVTDLADGCVSITDHNKISDALWEHYKASEQTVTQKSAGLETEPVLPEGFYFTTAQRRRFKALYHSFQLKTEDNGEKNLLKLITELGLPENDSPKRKTSRLLEALADYLSPFNASLRKDLEKEVALLKEAGWVVQFTPDMESEEVVIKAVINGEKKVSRLHKALGQLDYQRISHLLRGRLATEREGDDV